MKDKSIQAHVISAVPFSSEQQKLLTQLIENISSAVVEIHYEVDEKVLGGFIVKLDDRKIDASLKGELSQLVATLKNSV